MKIEIDHLEKLKFLKNNSYFVYIGQSTYFNGSLFSRAIFVYFVYTNTIMTPKWP